VPGRVAGQVFLDLYLFCFINFPNQVVLKRDKSRDRQLPAFVTLSCDGFTICKEEICDGQGIHGQDFDG